MKLELKMDNKTFWFCIAIIFLLGLLALSWNDTPILIERYNCSCPEKKIDFSKNVSWGDIKILNTSETYLPNFEYCEDVTWLSVIYV